MINPGLKRGIPLSVANERERGADQAIVNIRRIAQIGKTVL
jgi:hypothetical protein